MVERYQYPAHVEGRPPTIPDFGWFVQGPDIVRAPHQVDPGLSVEGRPPIIPDFGWNVAQPNMIRPLHPVGEGWLGQSLEPIVVTVPDFGWFFQDTTVPRALPQPPLGGLVLGQPPIIPDFAWFNQYPEQVVIAKPSPYYYPSTEFRTELPPTVTLDQWWQPASEPVRTIPPVQQGGIAFLDIEDVALVVYSRDGWPFLALINPADFPAGTQFFFEVILATDNGAITTFARLRNVTDDTLVADSTLSTVVTGLGDRLRSGAVTLAAGDKEYSAERGDASGTTHVRLYAAHIIKVTPP